MNHRTKASEHQSRLAPSCAYCSKPATHVGYSTISHFVAKMDADGNPADADFVSEHEHIDVLGGYTHVCDDHVDQ